MEATTSEERFWAVLTDGRDIANTALVTESEFLEMNARASESTDDTWRWMHCDTALRRKAQAAREQWEKQEAEERVKFQANKRKGDAENLVTLLKRQLGVIVPPEAVTFEDEMPVIELDGLRFSATRKRYYSEGSAPAALHLLGTCPRCQQPTVAEVGSLVDLAALIEEFQPYYAHHCERPERGDEGADEASVSEEPVPTCTPEERLLLDTLRRVLAVEE